MRLMITFDKSVFQGVNDLNPYQKSMSHRRNKGSNGWYRIDICICLVTGVVEHFYTFFEVLFIFLSNCLQNVKNEAIKEIQVELKKIREAHSNMVKTYEGKLSEFGIPVEELGFDPLVPANI